MKKTSALLPLLAVGLLANCGTVVASAPADWIGEGGLHYAGEQPQGGQGGDLEEQRTWSQRQQANHPADGADVKESFGDWAVQCRKPGSIMQCRMGQYQEDTKTGRMVFAMEISPPDIGGAKVVIMLPFGLQVTDGIRLKLDDNLAVQNAKFATCIPIGCLVLLKLTIANLEAVRQANKFQIIPKIYGSGSPAPFSVSLRGFSAAYARLQDLQQRR